MSVKYKLLHRGLGFGGGDWVVARAFSLSLSTGLPFLEDDLTQVLNLSCNEVIVIDRDTDDIISTIL